MTNGPRRLPFIELPGAGRASFITKRLTVGPRPASRSDLETIKEDGHSAILDVAGGGWLLEPVLQAGEAILIRLCLSFRHSLRDSPQQRLGDELEEGPSVLLTGLVCRVQPEVVVGALQ